MENTSLSNYSKSFGVALVTAGLCNSILVVAKEKSPSVLAAMAKMTGHHWVTHSLFVLFVFVFMGLLLARMNRRQGPKLTTQGLISCVAAGVLVSAAIIVGFYLAGD